MEEEGFGGRILQQSQQFERGRAGQGGRVNADQPAAGLFEAARDKVYPARQVLLIEVAGFNVLGRLIELFLGALNERAIKGRKASLKSDRTQRLLPAQFLAAGNGDPAAMSLYQRTLAVTDFVSCMTDTYAVSLFKKLTGISLPGE